MRRMLIAFPDSNNWRGMAIWILMYLNNEYPNWKFNFKHFTYDYFTETWIIQLDSGWEIQVWRNENGEIYSVVI